MDDFLHLLLEVLLDLEKGAEFLPEGRVRLELVLDRREILLEHGDLPFLHRRELRTHVLARDPDEVFK